MKKLQLCFLWHQHQPFYKDTLNNIYKMPWVFSHALKDYYDMLELCRTTNFPATFNLVPSLVYQIRDYEKDMYKDELLLVVQSEPEILNDSQKQKLMTYAFESMNPSKIDQSKRFKFLKTLSKEFQKMSNQELLDVQTHLLLAWLGEVSLRQEKFLQDLVKKDSYFSSTEKEKLLEFCHKLVAKVLPAHAEAWHNKEIAITTTPFFHPILPLLKDFSSARVALPQLAIPRIPSNMAEDIDRQITDARNYVEKELGQKVSGFWPSEGSVSPQVVEHFAAAGVRWISTDAGIFYNTMRMNRQNASKKDLYKPYRIVTEKGDVNIFFRDTELSDLIGFTYSQWDAQAAVNDFLSRLRSIYSLYEYDNEDAVVSIILDGENAWEYYPNNGYDFLHLLYSQIKQTDWINVNLFEEVLNEYQNIPTLPKLFSGSWIYSNFATWMGHPEKNKGWEYLVETRKILQENISALPEQTQKQVWFEMQAAEGSDWFWWYGDDFYSHFSDDFDDLFRLHLRNVYTLCKRPIPDYLFNSIRKKHSGGLKRKPESYLNVNIDGNINSYFEWLGAGEFDLSYDASTMQMGKRRLKNLYYGIDARKFAGDQKGLYLCIEGEIGESSDEILEVELINEVRHTIKWSMREHKVLETEGIDNPDDLRMEQDHYIEIFLPLKAEDSVRVHFKIFQNGELIEKAPLYSMAVLPLQTNTKGDWIV